MEMRNCERRKLTGPRPKKGPEKKPYRAAKAATVFSSGAVYHIANIRIAEINVLM
jgi:hypothetical protein